VIDPDLHLAKALVVEGNPMLRSITAAQLRDAGIGQVMGSGQVRDARLLLETETFDIVVCALEFDRSDHSGQDLLDELRREQLLPHRTVFLMVATQATYAQVVEAAEAALDGLIVRPFTASALLERLQEARQRKRLLADVMQALESGETDLALVRALRRVQEGHRYWVYCARLSAELLMRAGRLDEALRLFERVLDFKPMTWAQVGRVRAHMAAGRLGAAGKLLQDVLASDPGCADALDLQGRLRIEQSDFEGALAAYQAAADLTPGCLLRAQHAGALAFYLGLPQQALPSLRRARGMGIRSRLFDALTLYLLCLSQFDVDDRDGWASSHAELKSFARRHPESARLRRFVQATDALVAQQSGDVDQAGRLAHALGAEIGEPVFDMEAVQVVLTLWARLPVDAVDIEQQARFGREAGLRWGVSRAVVEFLAVVALPRPALVDALRQAQAEVNQAAEAAMQATLEGRADEALATLMERASQTRNVRLIEQVLMLARRHRDVLAPQRLQDWEAQASELLQRHRVGVNHIAGIQRSQRSPGGLLIRG
jgi:DNA-binding response OmpR family regulator